MQQNEQLYMLSDGFMDQFGGEKSEKYNVNRFEKLLLTLDKKTMSDQKNIVENELKQWQGENSQTDDILVIGLRFGN